jgi:hypothetical protein
MNLFPFFVNLNTVTIEFALSNHLFSMKLDTGSGMTTKQIPVIYKKYKEGFHLAMASGYNLCSNNSRSKKKRTKERWGKDLLPSSRSITDSHS